MRQEKKMLEEDKKMIEANNAQAEAETKTKTVEKKMMEAKKNDKARKEAEQSEKQFQEILPEAVSKANAAEDAVEKAVITSEMMAVGGGDLDEVRQAVRMHRLLSQKSEGEGHPRAGSVATATARGSTEVGGP